MTSVARVAGMPSWLTAELVLVILVVLCGVIILAGVVKLRGRGRSDLCARGEKPDPDRNGPA